MTETINLPIVKEPMTMEDFDKATAAYVAEYKRMIKGHAPHYRAISSAGTAFDRAVVAMGYTLMSLNEQLSVTTGR